MPLSDSQKQLIEEKRKIIEEYKDYTIPKPKKDLSHNEPVH